MKVLIFGATGMVGQGVLRECLLAPDVDLVVTIGRSPAPEPDPAQPNSKLCQIVHPNLYDLSVVEAQLTGLNACFFTLGVSAGGIEQAEYERITYDLTLAVAQTVCRLNPGITLIYVSGAGTDSSGQGRIMWARVKGRTENALLALPLAADMFRPGLIQPLDGIKSKTPAYRAIYGLMKPILPLLRALFPNLIVTTRELGQAMLAVARSGYSRRVLEIKDIRAVLTASSRPSGQFGCRL